MRLPGVLGVVLIGAALTGAPVIARIPQGTSAAGTRNAIAGRVLDAAGRPVSGVFVTLLQNSLHWNGVPRVGIVRMGLGVRTDTMGRYRLENLALGPYYVVALPENPPAGADGRANRAGFGTTYYPAAPLRADAREVTVTMNGPAAADITLAPAVLAVIAGTVIGQDGQPAGGGTLLIAHGDGLLGVHGRSTPLRPDGSFVLPALPPGTYILEFREGPWPPPRGAIPTVSHAKVVVDGVNVTGVRVAPIHRVRATGRIVVDQESRKLLAPAAIHVSGFPVIDGMPGPTSAPTMNDDLSFAFEAWPGANFVRVVVDAPGWEVKRISYNGIDVMRVPIRFTEGQEISGIEVEIVRATSRR
jgi:hypothetical protein